MLWDDERIEKLRKLCDQGKTSGEIGEIMGCSRQAILGKAKRLKLSWRRSPTDKSITPGIGRLGKTAHREQKPDPDKAEITAIKPATRPKKDIFRATAVTLEQAQERSGCRWPYGDKPYTFCGRPKQPITGEKTDPSYCVYHAKKSRGQGQ